MLMFYHFCKIKCDVTKICSRLNSTGSCIVLKGVKRVVKDDGEVEMMAYFDTIMKVCFKKKFFLVLSILFTFSVL